MDGFWFDSQHVQGISAYRPVLGPTVPPRQCVSVGISQGKVARLEVMKLTTHLHLLRRLRISAATPSCNMYRYNFTLIFITYVIKMGKSLRNVTSTCSGSKTFQRLCLNGTGMCCALLCPLILRECC